MDDNETLLSGPSGGRRGVPNENDTLFTQAFGDTLADELIRAGEIDRKEKSVITRPSGGCEDVIVFEIPANDDLLPDMEFTIGTLQACDSIPYNTIPEIPDEDEPSHAQTKRNSVSMDSTGEMNDLSRLIGHLHYDERHILPASHTLRERRLGYLREMNGSDQSRLTLATLSLLLSAARPAGWKIEVGVVGGWHHSPNRKLPYFIIKRHYSAAGWLELQREAIMIEVQKKRLRKVHPLMGQSSIQVPRNVGSAPQRSRQEDMQREEIEDFLRDADLEAADLDEGSMDAVVSAVLSAAAEAALLSS